MYANIYLLSSFVRTPDYVRNYKNIYNGILLDFDARSLNIVVVALRFYVWIVVRLGQVRPQRTNAFFSNYSFLIS